MEKRQFKNRITADMIKRPLYISRLLWLGLVLAATLRRVYNYFLAIEAAAAVGKEYQSPEWGFTDWWIVILGMSLALFIVAIDRGLSVIINVMEDKE